jgi:hypothetical protein
MERSRYLPSHGEDDRIVLKALGRGVGVWLWLKSMGATVEEGWSENRCDPR